MMKLLLLLLAALPLAADGPGVILSKYTKKDFALTADPAAPLVDAKFSWLGARHVMVSAAMISAVGLTWRPPG